MANHKSLWTAPAVALMLNSWATLTLCVAPPALVYADEISLTPEERVVVRTDEEERLASLDRSYIKQMKAQAKQYREMAELVAKQGGDNTPLLEAAAYFQKKADGD